MWNVGGGTLVSWPLMQKTTTNSFVSWKLKALYQGGHYYWQCQGSKKIEDKIYF